MQNEKTYSETVSSAYSEILPLISTEWQKDQLVNQIESLSQAIYRVNGEEARRIAEEGIDVRIAEIIKTIPADDLPTFLNDLKQKINSLPVAKITLSFSPTVSFVKKLHDFLIQNLATMGVVDIKVDPEIIAGLTIELGGKFTDLTVRKKLNEYI